MSSGRFEAMLNAITGYELSIEDLRGTRKLGQHKPGQAASAADGLEPFHPILAALMRSSR